MAESATAIVSLEVMKQQLGLESEFNAHDTLIQNCIEDAVSWVSKFLSVPLVDVIRTTSYRDVKPNSVLGFQGYFSAIDSIRYWTSGRAYSMEPDGSVSAPGRIIDDLPSRCVVVFPPSGGWPDYNRANPFLLNYKSSYELTGAEVGIRRAVIMLSRLYYDGVQEIRPTNAVYGVLQGYRSYAMPPVNKPELSSTLEVPHGNLLWGDDTQIEYGDGSTIEYPLLPSEA